ncbi:hypothetical protein Taro_003006 [Colocasia esculenta]|uniref:AB hydrolase-1 domain-containing protein n=1 Tax=Colocasia esculenta TaxID=4460 RepID=A0A843TQI1_COLES|nr:hypothetical protein [Colocasia esculenta]
MDGPVRWLEDPVRLGRDGRFFRLCRWSPPCLPYLATALCGREDARGTGVLSPVPAPGEEAGKPAIMLALATSVGCFRCRSKVVGAIAFPDFLPREVEEIKDPDARELARRMQRLPVKVSFSKSSIMSSCVKPLQQSGSKPVVLLHGFDSSLLEWRYTFPLLENSGLETWALDILGWGFSGLETLPSCNVAAKREHLYQFWQLHIREPMMLVGPSLGAATAIDFAAAYPEAVSKLVLIDASVYAEGTGDLAKLPRSLAYAGVSILKSVPLRLYANFLTFNNVPYWTFFDWAKIGRLHCLLPWWEDATVDFMISGGYNVSAQIKEIKKKTLIIWGEKDRVISSTQALRLHSELQGSILHQIPGCGHLPHVEEPSIVSKLIVEFAQCSLS